MVSDVARDWLGWLMLALGVSLPAHQFLGGLFLALAMGSMIARHRKSNAKLWAILATSAVVATVTVLVSQRWDHWGFLPQVVMAIAGGVSGWLVNFIVKIGDDMEDRTGVVAERLINRIFGGNNPGG